jgi:hypothetical protein
MKPARTKYASAETLVFPDAITLKGNTYDLRLEKHVIALL